MQIAHAGHYLGSSRIIGYSECLVEIALFIARCNNTSDNHIILNFKSFTAPQLTQFGKGHVRMLPAEEGTGVIAGGPVRAVLEMVGIKDIRTKSYGSNNPSNCVKATLNGLSQLRTAEQIAALRGKTVEELLD